MTSMLYRGPIQLVMFDWAGTTVDHGSLAPLAPFMETFRRHGIELSIEEARGPMGMGKRDHLQALFSLPRVSQAWQKARGSAWTQDDVERLYQQDFIPLQLECVEQHSRLIEGLLDVVAWLRKRETKLATSTGYFREAAERCWKAAAGQGFKPDANYCGADVAAGRPAPWMIFRAMESLNVQSVNAVLKIGDTLPDIGEGRNAGVWTVGVSKTSSEVGLSEEDFAALSAAEQKSRMATAEQKLYNAGAHYVIDSVADLPRLIPQIEKRIHEGETP